MIITKSKRYLYNMGKYESLEVTASITVDSEVDTDYKGRSVASTSQQIDSELDRMLESAVEEAHMDTDEPNSFSHLTYERNKGKK